LVTANSVGDLLTAHETALDALATNGDQADLLQPGDVFPISMEIDEDFKDWVTTHRWEFARRS
jgi:hypothetical protein